VECVTSAKIIAVGDQSHKSKRVQPVTGDGAQITQSHWIKYIQTRMWANAQRDGRPAEHRWRPLFNTAKFG